MFEYTGWWNNQPNGIIYKDGWLIGYKGSERPKFDIVIQEDTKNIADFALASCSGIISVVIGNNVKSIGEYAFSGCSGITNVTIGNSVTSIGRSAFSGCSGLTNVEIPNSVISIGEYAFSGCSGITDVTIGNSVTSIGYEAFAGCSRLTNVTIGNSVTSVDHGVFYKCNAIERLELNCPQIIDLWFSSCSSIKEVIIGNNVKSIGKYAFSGCSGITNVTIGNSVTSIGESAFSGCSGITDVTIGNSVTSADHSVFAGCNAIERLELNCPQIIDLWFSSCSSIKEVIIGDNVKDIGNNAFQYCSGLKSVVIPNSVISIGEYAFSGCSGITNVTIGNSVTSIGRSAFSGCSGITDMTIPNSVTSIGESAFWGTAWYDNQPDGIVYAGKVLYKYKGTMPKNTDITIAEGTLGITGSAFLYCFGLTSITIPNSISNIGKNAFWNCDDLKKINSFIPAENLFVPDDYAFEGVNKETCTLYVPEGDVSAYESIAGWNEFKHIVDFDPYFTITYVVDGEVYSTETAEYGSEILLIDEPLREGHTFSGWGEVPKFMPANDITVYGTFSVNKYIVTFKIGDEVIFSAPIEYGASIVAPEAPEKDGYAFDGWSEMPETMPAKDVTVYGTFTKLHVETVTINDSDNSFSMAEDTECGSIIYTRNFKNTNWQALYVPFEIPYEVIKDDFAVAYINDVHQFDDDDDGTIDRTRVEAIKVTGGVLKANYPYMIRAKVAGEKTITVTDATLYAAEENSIDCSSVFDTYTFTGTYSKIPAAELPKEEGYYALSGGSWKQFSSGATSSLGAFRIYMKIDSRNANATVEARTIEMRVAGDDEEETTGIENMEPTVNGQQSTVIYDLQGRRVEHPTKGLYIVNGEKVWIK